MATKLTLRMDERVIRRAKTYARSLANLCQISLQIFLFYRAQEKKSIPSTSRQK